MFKGAWLAAAAVVAAANPTRADTVYYCVPDEPRSMAADRLVSVEIRTLPNGSFDGIRYTAADGTRHDKSEQYDGTSALWMDGQPYWIGTSRATPSIEMIGQLIRQDGRLVYSETMYDREREKQPVVQVVSQCEPVVALQDTPPEAPAPVKSRNSVPIYVGLGGRAVFVDVILGSQPARMLIDTGATSVTVTESLAQALLLRGEAIEAPAARYKLADSSTTIARVIYVNTLKIGDNVLRDIEATVNPDAAEMLLGFPVLDQVGRFTVNTSTNRLIFGEETASESKSSPAVPPTDCATSDDNAIVQPVINVFDAIRSLNISLFAAQWADDAVYQNGKTGQIRSKAQIVATKVAQFARWRRVQVSLKGPFVARRSADQALIEDSYALVIDSAGGNLAIAQTSATLCAACRAAAGSSRKTWITLNESEAVLPTVTVARATRTSFSAPLKR